MFGAIAAGNAVQFGPDIGRAGQAADKIFTMIDTPSQINALYNYNKKDLNKDEMKGEIQFHDVWFRYPTRKSEWILRNLNMKLKANETVALVGESGCGKSTCVQLLLRFYDVNKGKITLDGVDIRNYVVSDLRKAMGLVQ
jgi:ATP-binding cassette subfamily B (MDR/TAP) protein 1